jgi:hypothetical protein
MLLRSGILVAGLLCAAAARGETLAVMPVKLLDTSHEAKDQSADHARRIASVADGLAADMQGPGRYAATVLVTPEAVAAACPRETAACLIGVARDAGADDALFVVVQKSSTLIMQVFAHVVELRNEGLVISRDLSFRGDTDESWMKMESFLAHTLAGTRE